MPKRLRSAEDLFAARLRQMLHIESRLADEVLPRLVAEAHSADLSYALERHLAETEAHVDSVRDALSEVGARAKPEESAALDALIVDHDRLLERVEKGDFVAADLVHAMAAATTEHLEISAYYVLSTMADAFGEETAAVRLREILEQEELALELVYRAVTKLLAEEVESGRR